MSERTETVATTAEAELSDTTTCDGYCDEEVHVSATVDVVVGAIVDEGTHGERHSKVTGVNSPSPVVEKWCISCARNEFDVETSARQRRVERAKRYITAYTVAAFAIGAILTLISASVFII